MRTEPTPGGRLDGSRGERLGRAIGVLAAEAALLVRRRLALGAWPVVWSLRTALPPAPPVLGVVPPFALTDETGRRFGSEDLAGRAWVASFIFTRCPTVCPRITGRMARIQDRARSLEPALRLVSISVDPEYDTPPRLAEYARSHGASPRMWKFLTGPADAVRATVERGLRVSMGGADEPSSPGSCRTGRTSCSSTGRAESAPTTTPMRRTSWIASCATPRSS